MRRGRGPPPLKNQLRIGYGLGNLNAGSVSVFLNRGDGTFAPQVTFDNFQPQSLALADFNDDGRMDAVVSNGNGGSVSVCRNLGGGKFEWCSVYAVSGYPYTIVVGDFDGDGHPDIADTDNATASISILRNLRSATSRRAQPGGPRIGEVGVFLEAAR